MKPIPPPDAHHLRAAVGWIELGLISEAKHELSRLALTYRSHPDHLEVRWAVCAHEDAWDEALRIARELIHLVPDRASGWLHQAFALRRIEGGGLDKAWSALLPAYDRFPKEAVIPYNLSCYACLMNRIPEARDWLKRAVHTGGKEQIKRLALEDADLRPLWEEIRGL